MPDVYTLFWIRAITAGFIFVITIIADTAIIIRHTANGVTLWFAAVLLFVDAHLVYTIFSTIQVLFNRSLTPEQITALYNWILLDALTMPMLFIAIIGLIIATLRHHD